MLRRCFLFSLVVSVVDAVVVVYLFFLILTSRL
jgi:hypothetical protein